MGSLISNLYDKYDDYTFLCEKYKAVQISMSKSGWLDHFYKLDEIFKNEKINQ